LQRIKNLIFCSYIKSPLNTKDNPLIFGKTKNLAADAKEQINILVNNMLKTIVSLMKMLNKI